jgi:hypothetical protein
VLRSIQAIAVASPAGGPASRRLVLNAHPYSAFLSWAGLGAPRLVASSAVVAVARESAMERREFGDISSHFMSTYAQANSYQVTSCSGSWVRPSSSLAASGSPVTTSNASPWRAAVLSFASWLSASALVPKVA